MTPKQICILVAMCWLTACNQTEAIEPHATDVNLTPLCNQGVYYLCGYIDKKASELYLKETFILPATFEKASEFRNGLAAVRVGGLYGYINASGEFAIPPQFTLAGDFDQGLAIIEQDGLLGVIDLSGKIVVEPQFSEATVFTSSLIFANLPKPQTEDKTSYVVGNSGIANNAPPTRRKHIISAYYNETNPQKAWKISGERLYDIKTGWVTSEPATFRVFDNKTRNYVWAAPDDKLFGLMKHDGSWQKEPRYQYPRALINNRAIYSKHSSSGAVDGTGETVLSVTSLHSDFSDPYAKVSQYSYRQTSQGPRKERKRQQYGLIDHFGKLVGGEYYEDVDTRGRVKKFIIENGKYRYAWLLIAPDGTLTPDKNIATCENYILTPSGDNKMHVLSPEGEKMLDYDFDAVWGNDRLFHSSGADVIGALMRGCGWPSGVTASGKTGTLLTDGTLVGGRLFDKVIWPGHSKQWVLEDGKWGLMDLDGTYFITPQYDNIQDLGFGQIQAKQGEKTYYINSRYTLDTFELYQRTETRPNYNSRDYSTANNAVLKNASHICPRRGVRRGARLTSEGGLWGMVDASGKTLIPAKHRALSCYENGTAWAPNEEKKQWCQIDQSGEFDLSRPCQITYYETKTGNFDGRTGQYRFMPERFDDDPFESSVLWAQSRLNSGQDGEAKPGRWIKNNSYWLQNEEITVPIEQ